MNNLAYTISSYDSYDEVIRLWLQTREYIYRSVNLTLFCYANVTRNKFYF